jgi:hypothetical protein
MEAGGHANLMILNREQDEAAFRVFKQRLFAYDDQHIRRKEEKAHTFRQIYFANKFLAQLFEVIIVILGDLTAGDERIRCNGAILGNELDKCLLVGLGGCYEGKGFNGGRGLHMIRV